jgi:hypothetical protein
LTDKNEDPAVAAKARFQYGIAGSYEMMANWFYLVGSICFIVGTIINMTAQRPKLGSAVKLAYTRNVRDEPAGAIAAVELIVVTKALGMTALTGAKVAEQRESHRRSGIIPRRRRNKLAPSAPSYRSSSNALAALRSVVANPSVNRS